MVDLIFFLIYLLSWKLLLWQELKKIFTEYTYIIHIYELIRAGFELWIRYVLSNFTCDLKKLMILEIVFSAHDCSKFT